jgi:hypothetical protein
MTAEEAEQMLSEWVIVTRDRDARVRAAVAAGITKHRVHRLTGLGRSTMERILASPYPEGPALAQPEAAMITETKPATVPYRRSGWSVAEARGFEPRMAAKPNRISSAAP